MNQVGRISHPGFLWITAVAIFVAAMVLELSGMDIWLQDLVFDFRDGAWVVDQRDPLGRVLFYTGPKVLLIAFGCSLMALIVGPCRWRQWWQSLGWLTTRARITAALLCAGSIPITVAVLKATSGVFCPSELARYGGSAAHRRPYSAEVCGESRGRCWPAGHASGGFALLSLLVLAGNRRRRVQAVYMGTVAGWGMGLYQSLKGAHFPSHTLVTFAISLCLVAAFQAALGRLAPAIASPRALHS